MLELINVWPLFGLSIRTPRLARDEDLPGIIEAAIAGIHDPDVMPFSVPWTDAPKDELIRNTVRYQWLLRSGITPDRWALNMVVLLDGKAIGMQDIGARDFVVRRTVNTGSWLSKEYQGRGFGKEMRAAALCFAFDHLGAEVAESAAATWNQSSMGVSLGLGYVKGSLKRVVTRPRQLDEVQEMSVTPTEFNRPQWPIGVIGLEAALKDLIRDVD